MIKNVNFGVKRGEVVGIAGLMGAGRAEFAMSLFGRSWGTTISGAASSSRAMRSVLPSVAAAIDAGLAYVTEDREQARLDPGRDDVRKNITLASLDQVAPGRGDRRHRRAEGCHATTGAACASAAPTCTRRPASSPAATSRKRCSPSGPIASSRSCSSTSRPGASTSPPDPEIYCIINELAEAGRGVVVISSEMPELLGICNRICGHEKRRRLRRGIQGRRGGRRCRAVQASPKRSR